MANWSGLRFQGISIAANTFQNQIAIVWTVDTFDQISTVIDSQWNFFRILTTMQETGNCYLARTIFMPH